MPAAARTPAEAVRGRDMSAIAVNSRRWADGLCHCLRSTSKTSLECVTGN